MEGALTFANGTWNNIGDDAAIGDHNRSGSLGLIGLNGTTALDFCKRDDPANWKSITYDGITLYMDGNCNYAVTAGQTTGNARDAYYLQSFDQTDTPYPYNYIIKSKYAVQGDTRFYLHVVNNNGDTTLYQTAVDHAYHSDVAETANAIAWDDVIGIPSYLKNDVGIMILNAKGINADTPINNYAQNRLYLIKIIIEGTAYQVVHRGDTDIAIQYYIIYGMDNMIYFRFQVTKHGIVHYINSWDTASGWQEKPSYSFYVYQIGG